MVNLLSKNKEDVLIDVMRELNGGKSPVTFGDVGIDENGKEYPLETELVKHEDYCTQQSLDYIFEIKRGFNKGIVLNREDGPEKEQIPSLKIDIKGSKVEKFFFDTHHSVKQCSDHYGVSTSITLI